MGTGKPRDFCWNDDTNTGYEWGTPGDADIDGSLPNPDNLVQVSYDACYIEFEFQCNSEFAEISFNYVWGSDEYEEYVDEPYNDGELWVSDNHGNILVHF